MVHNPCAICGCSRDELEAVCDNCGWSPPSIRVHERKERQATSRRQTSQTPRVPTPIQHASTPIRHAPKSPPRGESSANPPQAGGLVVVISIVLLIALFAILAQSQALGTMLLILGIVMAVCTIIGAVIFRTACWAYNKLVGGPETMHAVPEPDFGRACAIVFVAALINAVASAGISLIGIAQAINPMMINLMPLPISLLALAGMATVMLPTDFGKGLLVSLLHLAIGFCVGVVIFGFMLLVFVASR